MPWVTDDLSGTHYEPRSKAQERRRLRRQAKRLAASLPVEPATFDGFNLLPEVPSGAGDAAGLDDAQADPGHAPQLPAEEPSVETHSADGEEPWIAAESFGAKMARLKREKKALAAIASAEGTDPSTSTSSSSG